MKRKSFLQYAFVALLSLITLQAFAYDGQIGEEAGWQTDADGSITGTAGSKFIWVNEANFPDESFRNALFSTKFYASTSSNGDGDIGETYAADGVLSGEEISKAVRFNIRRKNIEDLKGIEFFNKLREFDCELNKLTNIDFSQNTELWKLACNNNYELVSINVSECKNLASLNLTMCKKIAAVDVSKNEKLESLDITNSDELTSIDVTNNRYLRSLILSENHKLAALDVTNNSELWRLSIHNCNVSVLDVTHNTKLEYLDCAMNKLSNLDVSQNLSLKKLECGSNSFSDLDVSNNTELTWLQCGYNKLTTLDVSTNTKLELLTCSNNKLTSLDLSNNKNLNDLTTNNNPINNLDLSENINLTSLSCSNNELKALDLSNNVKLKELNCTDNHMTELDLSMLPELSSGKLSPQTLQRDAVVLGDNRSIIAIPCNTNDGNLASYGNYAAETIDGNNYIIYVADGSADVDLYHKTVTYDYATGTTAKSAALKAMTVNITSSPYVMYVNPKAQVIGGVNYYGTLFLDYASIVPKPSVQCRYANSITEDEELNMVLIDDTKTIPANTGIYVRARKPGYYAFYEAAKGKEEETITNNILTGSTTDTKVGYKEVLTLGHENGTGELGFWNFTGNTVPAHRAYVPASVLSNMEGAKGLRLYFPDEEVNGIREMYADDSEDTIYNLAGQSVTRGELRRGIYIMHGRKIMVK